MKTSIVVSLQIEGWHCWPGAPEQHKYLRDRHRHVFHIRLAAPVRHDDRDIEFIEYKRCVARYLDRRYPDGELHAMSCEALATELVRYFEADWCEVLEDGENGAIVHRE